MDMGGEMSTLRDNADHPPVHLRSKRLFYVDPVAENAPYGWYFKVRGARCFGPFDSREEAGHALDLVVSRYRSLNDSSGR
jgi:hypothetical protein